MKSSEVYGKDARNKLIASVNKAKTLESNISNGRKIFRLFLWLNEIDGMHEIINNKKLHFNIKVLKIISSICSFIYYFTDNIVWLSKLDFVSPTVPFFNKKWGRIKDRFSLCKTVMELIIFSYIYTLKK